MAEARLVTGSGALCLFGDVHPAEAQSPCDEITRGSFTVQNHIDVSTIDAVALCKSDLTSFAFNSSSQQANNIIVLKHTRLKTQITENQGRTLTSCALPWACPKASFFPIQGLFKPTVGADARAPLPAGWEAWITVEAEAHKTPALRPIKDASRKLERDAEPAWHDAHVKYERDAKARRIAANIVRLQSSAS